MRCTTVTRFCLALVLLLGSGPLAAQSQKRPPASKPDSPAPSPGAKGADAQPATTPDPLLRPAGTPAPLLKPAPLTRAAMKVLALQVALDRAGFSPGEIDARQGLSTKRAMAARDAGGETALASATPSGAGGSATARPIGTAGTGSSKPGAAIPATPAETPAPPAGTPLPPTPTPAEMPAPLFDPLTTYLITEDEARGPFEPIPEDMMEKSKLPALGYTSILEMLGERFHSSPAFIRKLNPGVSFKAGDTITVPNVEPLVLAAGKGKRRVPDKSVLMRVITLSEKDRTLTVRDADGKVLMSAPVTVGSSKDPLPVGEWKVTAIIDNPVFYYNPALFWDADPTHAKAEIPPGPNNPVGPIWIDIDREHFGFHGTPEPSTVGKTQSHGCVRLTNWDVVRLAALVGPGTKVILQ